MPDLDRVLIDISHIRQQLARGSEFHGYGPATVAMTGLLALVGATAQRYWIGEAATAPLRYLQWWALIAAVSFGLITIEAVFRARRAYGGMALSMLQSALEPFLPAIVAGGLLTVILPASSPASLWMLPGLWQVIFSLGVFASCRLLPRAIFVVGVWYLFCGIGCLAWLGPARSLTPWAMGIPFAFGQCLVAGILQVQRNEV